MVRLGWLGTVLAVAWAHAAQQTPVQEELVRQVEETRAASGAPSISVAIIKDGQLLSVFAVGEADLETKRPADVATRYAVGSVSKQFTAAALLKLEEQGKLSLDDTVAKYYPEYTRARDITVRELLSHTSGYEDYAPQDYMIPAWLKPTTPGAILNEWAKKPLNFDPGTRWQYSNTNYVLAGKIAEKVAGRPLHTLLREWFFEPNQMQSAGDCDAATASDAKAYTRYALGPPRPALREARGWYFAAGDLCMTAADLAKWDMAILRADFLSAKEFGKFTEEVKLTGGSGTRYALGLQRGMLADAPTLYHGGEVSGFLSLNTVAPTRKAAFVVLTNTDNVNFHSRLTAELAQTVLPTAGAFTPSAISRQIRSILEGLAQGRIDHSLVTGDGDFYFQPTAVEDFRHSLEGLGRLIALTEISRSLRGGMTHLIYQARYEKRTISLNLYLKPDGKFEQFLLFE